MFRVLLISIVLSGSAITSESAAAEYYLKFTTSGSAISSDNLQSQSAAWVDVSVVTSVGSDGNVHWPNSEVGSDVSYYISYYGNKTLPGANKNSFYVADVPRSITITEHDGASSMTITAGDAPKRFSLGPSFLLPDGFLVAPGVNKTNATTRYVRMVAASRYKAISSGFITCSQGWGYGNGSVRIRQEKSYFIVNKWSANEGYHDISECVGAYVFSGPAEHHVVRFR